MQHATFSKKTHFILVLCTVPSVAFTPALLLFPPAPHKISFSFPTNPLQFYIQLTVICNTAPHKLLSVHVFVSYISFVWFSFYSGYEKVYFLQIMNFPLDHKKAGINMQKINILFLSRTFQSNIQSSKGRVRSHLTEPSLLSIQFFLRLF
jgi:hypothetical protein